MSTSVAIETTQSILQSQQDLLAPYTTSVSEIEPSSRLVETVQSTKSFPSSMFVSSARLSESSLTQLVSTRSQIDTFSSRPLLKTPVLVPISSPPPPHMTSPAPTQLPSTQTVSVTPTQLLSTPTIVPSVTPTQLLSTPTIVASEGPTQPSSTPTIVASEGPTQLSSTPTIVASEGPTQPSSTTTIVPSVTRTQLSSTPTIVASEGPTQLSSTSTIPLMSSSVSSVSPTSTIGKNYKP